MEVMGREGNGLVVRDGEGRVSGVEFARVGWK